MEQYKAEECVPIIKTYYKNGREKMHIVLYVNTLVNIIKFLSAQFEIWSRSWDKLGQCVTSKHIGILGQVVRTRILTEFVKLLPTRHLHRFVVDRSNREFCPLRSECWQRICIYTHKRSKSINSVVCLINGCLTKKILFSDAAHFHLNGFVNKQNFRIWGS